jgi:hypothetical protein
MNKKEKEEYHITTRRVYNFKSGAFESDYNNKQEAMKAMKNIVDGHTPTEVEQKTMTVEKVDEMADNLANEQTTQTPPSTV